MKNLSSAAKVYILSTIIAGLGLVVWMARDLDWANLGLYILAALGAGAQTYKVEGPNDQTNYNIAWFVYGFTFIALGAPAAVIVIVVSHLVDWAWHKYPWYIQSFNIGAHVIPAYLAGLIYGMVSSGSQTLDLTGAMGLAAALLIFVLGNHFLVGVVIKLARGQSFAESGVFAFFTLLLDFTLLSMGTVTAFIWFFNPFASLLNILPLYLLYNALRVPALTRQVENMEQQMAQSGD
jgi:hypothetical protein